MPLPRANGLPAAHVQLALGKRVATPAAPAAADRHPPRARTLAHRFATASACAFMVEHTNGILCAPLSEARAAELKLPPMVANNKDRNQTAFTVTVDAAKGTSTGASASDRAHTIRVLSDPSATAGDFNRPGHMFPLVARPGGVLERGGHTEASVDLCLLAGCRPVALICELMHRNGTMMRRPACHAIAKEHNLTIITTAQIVAFRTGVQNSANPPLAIATPADDKVRGGPDLALRACVRARVCTAARAGRMVWVWVLVWVGKCRWRGGWVGGWVQHFTPPRHKQRPVVTPAFAPVSSARRTSGVCSGRRSHLSAAVPVQCSQ